MFTKKAVKYDDQRNPHLDCECGNRVSLPVVKGLPMTYQCICGMVYDSRGYIITRPMVQHGNA